MTAINILKIITIVRHQNSALTDISKVESDFQVNKFPGNKEKRSGLGSRDQVFCQETKKSDELPGDIKQMASCLLRRIRQWIQQWWPK